MSLRVKLIWPYLVVITAIVVINLGYLYHTKQQSSQRELVKDIRLLTHSISHSIEGTLASKDKSKAQTLLDELLNLEAVASVQLYSKENQPFILVEKSFASHAMTKTDERLAASQVSKKNYLYIVEPIVHDGNVVASLGVTLIERSIFDNVEVFVEEVAGLVGLLIIYGVLLYIYIGIVVIKPLIKLNGVVQELTHEHTNYLPLRFRSKDEVGELIYSFDRMMTKLLSREKQRHHSLEVLKQKNSISEDVIESIQYSLIITDNLGTIIHCNSATYHMFERSREVLLQSNIRDLIQTKTSTELEQVLDKRIEHTEIKLRSFDNKHQYSLTCQYLSKQDYILFEIRDITELEAVKSRERIAARVFENSQDGLIVIDENAVITVVNPAVGELLGVNAEELIGQSIVTVIRSHKLRKMIPSIIKSIENFGIWQGEVTEQCHSGQLMPMFAKVNRILKCENNKLYDSVIVLTDLSDAKEMERLEYLTHHDSLTGLANRTKFNLVLDNLVKRSAYVRDEFAILYMDLDGFKAVNDTYGHDAGDAVLKIVSERMASVTRHTDLIARLAGDEFAMLINPANQATVTRVSEQLLESISEPISYKGDTLNVGVSIGVKLVGLNERDAERVLKSADTAMYQAKKSGKGRAILMGYEL